LADKWNRIARAQRAKRNVIGEKSKRKWGSKNEGQDVYIAQLWEAFFTLYV
jgi:hypothetical protein